MPSKDKYSDPKLRDEVKEELKQSDKGGEPGQWSARKVSTFKIPIHTTRDAANLITFLLLGTNDGQRVQEERW